MCHAPAWAPSLCMCKSSDLCCSNTLALCNAGRISMSSAVKASFVDCMAGEEGPQRMTRGITCTINTDMTTTCTYIHAWLTSYIHHMPNRVMSERIWPNPALSKELQASRTRPLEHVADKSALRHCIKSSGVESPTSWWSVMITRRGLWDVQHDPSKPDVLCCSTSSFAPSWNHLSMQAAMQGLEFLGFLVKWNSAQQTTPLQKELSRVRTGKNRAQLKTGVCSTPVNIRIGARNLCCSSIHGWLPVQTTTVLPAFLDLCQKCIVHRAPS